MDHCAWFVMLAVCKMHPGSNPEGVMYLSSLTEKYKKAFCQWFGPFQARLAVVHPDTVKGILQTAEPKPGFGGYNLLLDWLGCGLLLSSGEKWKRSRRLLTHGFHFDVLQNYVKKYHETAEKLMAKFSTAAHQGNSVDVSPLASMATLEVIMNCAFSCNTDLLGQGDDHPYHDAVVTLSRHAMHRFFNPHLWFDFVFYLTPDGKENKRLLHYVHGVTESIIEKRKEQLKSIVGGQGKKLDFLDILLMARDENGVGLSDSDIRAEADTFLFRGHDTTASALAWTLYSLAKYPDHQKKVQAEVDNLLAERENKEFTWNDLHDGMPYLSAFLKESMRMHSPVPLIARTLTQELTIDGHVVPVGTKIDICIHQMNHNPVVFPDHMEFRPERFLNTDAKKTDPFSFVPFSAGPRNCIGQNFAMNELKVMLGKTVQSFELTLDPTHQYLYKPDMVMRAVHGIKLFIKHRN
ncbi:phylloquinone omega-hydroxylase CYP4F2 isoform X2 [Lingula anatina]|uniref:Phylloquinone omega-hydroxylase CYP4F2 isoform X2 n=1 Tax=Lingula anatina TaxID=7574 RepID=A0A1S3J4Q5_LINAN|nr:phylloquinone omega-hydroxylase CYP4F2 isoform X2 [Lingula anatina]|eukprot:XP_013405417.1 phylloquinone omega-hydroxylase CYP4F2 isoform X2 [Lingula anatina]